MKRICVFCGSNIGRNPSYRAEAEKPRPTARRGVTSNWSMAAAISG